MVLGSALGVVFFSGRRSSSGLLTFNRRATCSRQSKKRYYETKQRETADGKQR